MKLVVVPVAVAPPDPSAQCRLTIVPSTSEDAPESKVHVSPLHWELNDATGGRFVGGGVESPGRNTVWADPLCAATIPLRASLTGELRTVVVPSPSWPLVF